VEVPGRPSAAYEPRTHAHSPGQRRSSADAGFSSRQAAITLSTLCLLSYTEVMDGAVVIVCVCGRLPATPHPRAALAGTVNPAPLCAGSVECRLGAHTVRSDASAPHRDPVRRPLLDGPRIQVSAMGRRSANVRAVATGPVRRPSSGAGGSASLASKLPELPEHARSADCLSLCKERTACAPALRSQRP
jgi:hypothetical protein